MDAKYIQYTNIIESLEKFRKFKLEGKLSKAEFTKQMQYTQYVKMTYGEYCIVMIAENSDICKKAQDFTKIQNEMKNFKHLFLYMNGKPGHTVKKKIGEIRDYKIKLFDTVHYNIDLELGPYCAKHTILTPEEILHIIEQDHFVEPHQLKKILETCPHVMRIGGVPGDVIRIEAPSELIGKRLTYRIVTPARERNDPILKRKKEVEPESGSEEYDGENTEVDDDEEDDESDVFEEDIKSEEPYSMEEEDESEEDETTDEEI